MIIEWHNQDMVTFAELDVGDFFKDENNELFIKITDEEYTQNTFNCTKCWTQECCFDVMVYPVNAKVVIE